MSITYHCQSSLAISHAQKYSMAILFMQALAGLLTTLFLLYKFAMHPSQ